MAVLPTGHTEAVEGVVRFAVAIVALCVVARPEAA